MKGKGKKKKYFNQKPKPQKIVTNVDKSAYVLFNPKFDIRVVTQLLPADCNMMIIRGEPKDFEEDPSQVFRIVKQDPNTKITGSQEET